MKAITAAAMLLGLGTAALPATASAQGWRPIAQRQANLDTRIERGIRSGQLTRPEARRLSAEFNQLERLENRYRANGLTRWERNDLNRRYDALGARVLFDRNDGQYRRR